MRSGRTATLWAVGAVLGLALAPSASSAQGVPARPRITGLAHVAFYVHDIEASRGFYRDLLGFEELSPVRNADGSLALTFIKINERQFIELFPEREPGVDRFAHYALEVDDVEAMRVYLKARGVSVPEKVTVGRVGNTSFTAKDPDGHTVEFLTYGADGLMAKSKGAAMPSGRISTSMRHGGILVGSLGAAIGFYRDILGFRETWRGSRDGKTLDWVNLQLPDGDDYMEFMLYGELPAPDNRGSQHHLCLVVPDIEAAAAAARARAAKAGYTKPIETRTGINRKRQLNLFDPDGTRTELMEPGTVDGAPAPSSSAPPPRK
jgi:catechol 2,3-dioxygenase-like lactoylglutathione lyase family enzyme